MILLALLPVLAALSLDGETAPRVDGDASPGDSGSEQVEQGSVYREDELEAGFLEDPGAFRKTDTSWTFAATPFTVWLPDTDFADDPGSVSTTRGGVSLAAIRPLDEKRRLTFGLGHERSAYSFDGSDFVGVEEPFDGGSITSASISLVTRESETLRWSAVVSGRVGMEDGAKFGDSATWAAGGTVTFPVLDEVLLTVGGFVTTRLEDDPFFIPWVQLEWQITERLRLGRQGSGVGLGYRLAGDVHTYSSFSFDVRQFRLDDDGPFPEAVVRDDELGVNLGAVWTPNPSARIEGFVGIVRRELTLLDGDAALSNQLLELAPRLGLSASWRF